MNPLVYLRRTPDFIRVSSTGHRDPRVPVRSLLGPEPLEDCEVIAVQSRLAPVAPQPPVQRRLTRLHVEVSIPRHVDVVLYAGMLIHS